MQNKQGLKKIVYITGSLNLAGAERQLLNLIHALHAVVPLIYVICFKMGPLRDEYLSAGAKVIFIDKGQGSFFSKVLKVWKELRSTINQIQPDLVHSQLPQTNILSCFALWNFSVPLIVSERGMGRTRPLWEKSLRYFAYRRPDAFITNSLSIKERIVNREKISRCKITVIKNCINMPQSHQNSRENLLKELKLVANSIILVSVGGLRAVKGYQYLLNSFARVSATCPDLYLVIAGEGPERDVLENTIHKLNLSRRVYLIGRRNDIPSILAASDIFVSSSISEGQSNAILEAMASGLPVIATDVGGTPEILSDGTTGVLVTSQDINELSSVLKEMYFDIDRRALLGSNAKMEVLEKYTLQASSRAHCDLYGRLQKVMERSE